MRLNAYYEMVHKGSPLYGCLPVTPLAGWAAKVGITKRSSGRESSVTSSKSSGFCSSSEKMVASAASTADGLFRNITADVRGTVEWRSIELPSRLNFLQRDAASASPPNHVQYISSSFLST